MTKKYHLWSLIAVTLAAACMRLPITGVPAIIEPIRSSFSLTTSAVAWLTTLPLLAFALAAQCVPWLSKRYSLEWSLVIALALVVLGMLIRWAFGVLGLYLGTALLGFGIGIINVALPSLVKQYFPLRIAQYTSLYSLVMGLTAALGSAAAVPMEQWFTGNWSQGLLLFVIVPVAAILVWLKIAQRLPEKNNSKSNRSLQPRLWRQPIAWSVACFMALNSIVCYIMIAWLPSILVGFDFNHVQAGSMLAGMQVASAATSFLLLPMLRSPSYQQSLAVSLPVISALAFIGFIIAPQWSLAWVLTYGMCSTGGLILGLSFIGLRTQNIEQSTSLSAMSQCLGYLLASVGPLLAASLLQYSRNWLSTIELCAALSLLTSLFGYIASQDRVIELECKPAQE